jgi:hypothetical protein
MTLQNNIVDVGPRHGVAVKARGENVFAIFAVNGFFFLFDFPILNYNFR